MKSKILVLIVSLLFLTNTSSKQTVYSDPIVPSATEMVTLTASLDTSNLKPLQELSLLRPLIPNPSIGGSGYTYGNCTWFAAQNAQVPDDLGNANTWAVRAAGKGFVVSAVPKVGNVAASTAGAYGHVGIIVAVGPFQVLLKEANVYGLGVVDERWVPIGQFKYIDF